MNFNKYFAIFIIVILGLLCQHVAQGHGLFGDLKRDVERDAHEVDEKVDNIKHNAEDDIHDEGHKIENEIHDEGHKIEKVAKKAYKVYKVVQDVETAGKVIEVAGAVAHVVEKL
ncbi:hypothetical protein FF38_04936 [Lucilia cuprina]|uniref:Uncharacterized protein n=1 Tax=Lucilia cuprina TaxID=7375 RepID=A0A0L0C086_LUCCU|nr:hypothetical protein CVS40_8853 [Lucilia cuprina]KNC25651.1 hypothetical protein FF38_04936 [Lucilia cuprina]